jgi:hypothetical protein
MSSDAEKPLTVSREDLYELTLSPMLSLANDFGIFDVALVKRCRRLEIPVPGRGYSGRVEAVKPRTARTYRSAIASGSMVGRLPPSIKERREKDERDARERTKLGFDKKNGMPSDRRITPNRSA